MSLRKKIYCDSSLDVASDNGQDSKKYRSESSSNSFFVNLFKILGILLAVFFLSSYFFTETWTWDYKGKYTNWRNWIPRKETVFTLEELSKYDGSDPELPIYLAISGEVFDVTQGRDYYGKGGSYGFFSGRDASRAYVTGCFDSPSHLSHDLRGLTPNELKSIEDWTSFYRDHHTYFKVGRVALPPIDPNSPIPPSCKAAKEQKP